MKRLYILTLCSVALAAWIFFFKKRSPTTIAAGHGLVVPKEWLQSNPRPLTPTADLRPADQTFLTYPEWYLVFSPEEQANYFKEHTASTFPFMSNTAQIWQGYRIVNDQIKDNFPTNYGYHFMIWVIGSSCSVEYSIKAWYETLIGRITDTGYPLTGEDRFNAKFTQAYVDFIKDRPWYEFDFKRQFKDLWSTTSFWGNNFARKMERRYILSSELLVKYAYGKIIGFGTRQTYDVALPTTAVVLDNDSLLYLPRYDRFAAAAAAIAKEGHSFQEIAGNRSAILVTVLVPSTRGISAREGQLVFKQPIASDPSTVRMALVVPVASLSTLLNQLDSDKVHIEHVFDY
jgi:hypothetical protein